MEEEKQKEPEAEEEPKKQIFSPLYRQLGHDMNYNPLLTFTDEEDED